MIKPLRMTDQTTCVSLRDSAIDIEGMTEAQLEAYAKEVRRNPGCWRDLLKLKDGESPTVFEIGVVPSGDVARIMDECKIGTTAPLHHEASWRFFLSGIRAIKNWPEEPRTVKRGGVEYVDSIWLASTFVRGLRDVAYDVGTLVYHFNQLTGEEVKN